MMCNSFPASLFSMSAVHETVYPPFYWLTRIGHKTSILIFLLLSVISVSAFIEV